MNPQIQAMHPAIMVIFGVTGDLSVKKVLPALFHLFQQNSLPKRFAVIGFSRRNWNDGQFRDEVKKILIHHGKDRKKLATFLQCFHFQSGLFHEKESYKNLSRHIDMIDRQWGVCTNTLFHLAVPPEYYSLILKNIDKYHLSSKCGPGEGWSRILVEKPFGNDYATAQKLDSMLGAIFREKQIFRVDHYLGKETVQNILAFRFSNSLFEELWDNKHIEKIEIKLLEKGDVGTRGEYYDATGALRDVGQNHILQMLALIAMDNPMELNGDLIRKNRAKAIQSLKIITGSALKKRAIRGQYTGYRNAEEVNPRSRTETYFRIKSYLEGKRWRGVPFYLESGKGLKESKAEIVVHFKGVDPCFCPPDNNEHNHQNVIIFMIQPNQGITVRFWSKKPGLQMEIEPRNLTFHYKRDGSLHLSGYEKLLYDAILGDQTLFSSTQEVLAAWRFITPIVQGWKKLPLHLYKKGSRRPGE